MAAVDRYTPSRTALWSRGAEGKVPVELADYLRVLRKRWALILVFTLLGVSLGAGISLVQPRTYEAKSEVFVSTQGGDSSADRQQGNNYTLQRVKTYAHLATTEIVLQPVIDELGLDASVGQVAERVSASAVVDTTILEITAMDEDAQRSADLANAVAATLSDVVEEAEPAEGDEGRSSVRLTTAQSAAVPLLPVSPRVPVTLGLGALVGFSLGFGVAVLREVLDTRIRGASDVEAVTTHPLVGGIISDSRVRNHPLIVESDPLSPVAESFRALRTNLQFVEVDGRRRSFAITSSLPNEGKSTTAMNLALTLSDAGETVALVDADLRRPKVASYMGLEGGVGLTDVLINRSDLADAVQEWGNGGLYVLPAGQVPPNPSELLGSNAMRELVTALEREFDWVIFDTPPLLPVTDAVVLAQHLTGAVVAVKSGQTTRHQLESAIGALENVETPVAGVVLTMVPAKASSAYGYGYGYLSEQGAAPRRGGLPPERPATPRPARSAESFTPSPVGDAESSPAVSESASGRASKR